MKVLVATTLFAPTLGGMQTVASLLVRGLTDEGHRVTVLTCTQAVEPYHGQGTVIRRPSLLQTFRSFRESDAIIMLGLTLKLGWPLLLMHRDTVVSHQIYPHVGRGIVRWLRNTLARRAKHVACSDAVANSLEYLCTVVGNSYEKGLYKVKVDSDRSCDLVFLGRLIPEKGLDILLDALGILSKKGITPTLSVAGSGQCREELESRAARLGIAHRVRFLGAVVGEPLVNLLNAHRILVVPSTWEEPFGIVALEGIACGCVVVGSAGGGLPDAIGPCGITFASGDREQLATVLEAMLKYPENLDQYRRNATSHLSDHEPALVVRRYLNCLRAN